MMIGFSFLQINGSLLLLDFFGIEYLQYLLNSIFDLFGLIFVLDLDGFMYSVGFSLVFVDWSYYDFGEVNFDNFVLLSYSQIGVQSFNGMFDFGSGFEQFFYFVNMILILGDVFEVEDFIFGNDGDYDGFGSSNFFR